MSLLTQSMLLVGLGLIPAGEGNYQKVAPALFANEKHNKKDIYILEFTFRKPRYIMVNVPGKGRRLIWYMAYKVTNKTGKPRDFTPQFTLVASRGSGPGDGKVYQDVILPAAQRAIVTRERPISRVYDSVETSLTPIANSPDESAPQSRLGVAMWEDVDLRAKDFTIYITGLSNGYAVAKTKEGEKPEVLRKTLKIEFAKPGDVFYPTENEIKMVGTPEWIYR